MCAWPIELARAFDQEWGVEYGIDVSPRWIGSVLRSLGVQPQKSNGVYVIPTSEYPRLRDLFGKYFQDFGDFGDVENRSEVEAP